MYSLVSITTTRHTEHLCICVCVWRTSCTHDMYPEGMVLGQGQSLQFRWQCIVQDGWVRKDRFCFPHESHSSDRSVIGLDKRSVPH